ncbi:head-tail adaptor protein [Turicibacter sanguinis]|uniref:head-tail adaptor protein n=1 Tax=Turicibacter sanguinis TaxID=154288 RepID=UPI0018AAEA43|nr:head-tail adaptor protein [Turicibacter sanguinis]MDB8553912.1 head-tail adaptor protein [Turicibacter sanguinis]
MNPNQPIKFDSFNDGIIQFGDYIEGYDEHGDATEKEFVSKGRLFFSFSSIREQDALKYDSSKRVTMKIKIPYLPLLNSNHVIRCGEEYYGVTHIDPGVNRKSLFLYLSSYIESMRYKVEVLNYTKPSTLEDAKLVHFRTLWCDVVSNKTTLTTNADKESLVGKKSFIVRYLSELDHTVQSISTKRLKYKDKIYKIISTTNVNEANELLEIEVEEV